MNILFIISSLRHGGAEKQNVIDANRLSGNHKITFITFRGGELSELLSENVNLIKLKKSGYLQTAKKLREIILKEKIDIVNASLFASMIISVLACDKIDIPVIWHFHSHEYDISLRSKIAFKYFALKESLKKIFYVSEELMIHMKERGFDFPESKKEVLYNNYTIEGYSGIRKAKDFITIGYVGRLVKLKRVELLIESAEYLIESGIRNFRIEIVGDGECRQELEKLTAEKNLENYISFVGFCKEVEKYYDGFDIFALPSREECLSISLIDAGSKGIPSVAFNAGGNDEIIIDGNTGFIVKDRNHFFEKIKELYLDDKKRTDLGANAYRYCMEKFSAGKRISAMEKVFNNFVKN